MVLSETATEGLILILSYSSDGRRPVIHGGIVSIIRLRFQTAIGGRHLKRLRSQLHGGYPTAYI